MNKQQGLTPAELELTQRMQMHFPQGLSSRVLNAGNGCRSHRLTGAIRKMMDELAKNSVIFENGLFSFVHSVSVAHFPEFVVGDYFKRGHTQDGVTISSTMGDDFEERFRPKIEKNVTESVVQVYKLLGESRSSFIINEFGGKNRVETALAHIWHLLAIHGRRGEGEGILSVDGSPNVFFSYDVDDILWSVIAERYTDGWLMCANPIKSCDPWKEGTRIFRP